MSPASTERVESAIKAILVPFLELNSGAVGAIVNVETVADQARVAIILEFPVSGIEAQLVEEVRAVVGQETGVADPDSAIAMKYLEIARRASARLAIDSRDRKAAFPDCVVEGFS